MQRRRFTDEFTSGDRMNLSEAVLKRRVWNKPTNDHLRQTTILKSLDPYISSSKISYDVGAATGHITCFLAERSDFVVAFEAVPAVYKQTEIMASKYENIITYNMAVCDEAETFKTFYVDDKRLSNSGFQNLVSGPNFQAPTTTLDFIDLGPCGFIKIDVEGTELEVLHGAESIVERDAPNIMVEIYEPFTVKPLEGIFQFLMGKGYKCSYYWHPHGLVQIKDVGDGVHAVENFHKRHDGDFLFYK
jgi:FkbM family methyltransferase